MPLRLYDTFAKAERDFEPLEDGIVRMYTCGPTVYGRPHIGNYSSFLLADLLRRWLEAGHGYRVTHVKNITDVGHLVADRDEGEDKVEKEARRIAAERGGDSITHDDVIAVARMYEEQYRADERALNMIEPEHRPRASETIPEMTAMITELIERGHAYETEDGIYFSVESFSAYGSLSGNTLENLSSGARIAVDESKRHPADFALWKKCVGPNANHVLRWDSPWGPGFPGWHIECSCMSQKFLGVTMDIHTGGEDLIFPHHECEIAQSEGSSGQKAVRYWLHRRFIDIGEQKMSKSIGNVKTIDDIRAMGYSPMDLRYYLLSVHYRTNLKFTEKGIDDAHKARRKIVDWMEGIESWGDVRVAEPPAEERPPVSVFRTRFTDAMNEDLNTPKALAAIFDCMNATHKFSFLDEEFEEIESFIALIRDTFGCFEAEDTAIPEDALALARERDSARAQKDFAASDRLRDELVAMGFEVRDTPEGTQLRPL